MRGMPVRSSRVIAATGIVAIVPRGIGLKDNIQAYGLFDRR